MAGRPSQLIRNRDQVASDIAPRGTMGRAGVSEPLRHGGQPGAERRTIAVFGREGIGLGTKE